MYYKVSPVIIIVLVLIIVLICFIGGFVIFGKNASPKNSTANQISTVLPVLDLSLSSNEENQESVKILATATTEDSDGIYSITLPNGSLELSDKAEYEVTQNGNYTFKAKGNNGQTASLAIEVNNIREASATSPYMPTGFTHLEGEVEDGYVIQDEYGNEFVWVPVESGKLTRNTLLDTKYQESNSSASALVNSVAQNYGFYIARYESSVYETNGEKVASSKAGVLPWTNVTYTEATSAASKAATTFGYEGYQTAILNSYAWDTALLWIDSKVENYSTNTGYGNYSGSIRNTGATQTDIQNNICDLAGNVREWTTEIYKETTPTTTNTSKNKNKKNNVTNTAVVSETVNYRVIRGGSANLSRTASSHTGYKENTSEAYWGFRMILYK